MAKETQILAQRQFDQSALIGHFENEYQYLIEIRKSDTDLFQKLSEITTPESLNLAKKVAATPDCLGYATSLLKYIQRKSPSVNIQELMITTIGDMSRKVLQFEEMFGITLFDPEDDTCLELTQALVIKAFEHSGVDLKRVAFEKAISGDRAKTPFLLVKKISMPES